MKPAAASSLAQSTPLSDYRRRCLLCHWLLQDPPPFSGFRCRRCGNSNDSKPPAVAAGQAATPRKTVAVAGPVQQCPPVQRQQPQGLPQHRQPPPQKHGAGSEVSRGARLAAAVAEVAEGLRLR